MYYLGITTNIMSLAGIIIAVGDMVDSAVVLIENAHKKIEADNKDTPRMELVLDAARELGPSAFGSLLVLTVSFLPIFTLEAKEGRLFTPLAFTKSFSMAFAALLSITLVPALMVFFIKGKILPEMKNPLNRFCIALYKPLLRTFLRLRYLMIVVMLGLFAATIYPWSQLGSEFMPPLEEGSILFMPVTVPGLPIEEARKLVQLQDRILKSFPEVERVFGKAGRAETATDPAPLSMFETVITLKPSEQWRDGMTKDKLVAEMEHALLWPGVQNAFTMPIKARVDMLSTGIRTPIGIKIYGSDLIEIAKIGEQLEGILKSVPGTRSVYAERELGGFFLDFTPDRAALARYGLRVMDVLQFVESAIGGEEVDTTIEGRERYSINVRYPRELRDDPERLGDILIPIGSAPLVNAGGMNTGAMPSGGPMGEKVQASIPLSQLGKFEFRMGAPMIKSEGGSISGWVYIDIQGRDIGSYVNDAKAAVNEHLNLEPGYTLQWTGQYEFMERVAARMKVVVPLTLLLVFGILYMNFNGVAQVFLVMLSVPFAAIGSIWTLYWFEFNTSIAVWVGVIALVGVATETASMMLVYLEQEYKRWNEEGRIQNSEDLIAMAIEAGALRVRPLLMTVIMNIVGLLPVMFDDGIGSDVAKRIAAPLWGGLISLTILTLAVIPALYIVWRELQRKLAPRTAP
jgi:Cu(I)/Ag(I) efflux system membrane protein CusA/SilA